MLTLHMHSDAVLKHFSIDEQALLGSGGESQVYAMGERQVLRVYRSGTDPTYPERLQSFYEAIAGQELPFEVPAVEETGALDDVLYAIERRIAGSSMTDFLLASKGAARARCLNSYTAAVEYIQTIPIDAEEFGELLVSEPLRRPEWSAYLQARARQSLLRGYPDLSADVPRLASVIESWEDELSLLQDVTTPRLVHGDYFPGNVLVDQLGDVRAVIDFSPMTVAGDPRLDLVCALIFLELDHGYQPTDSDTMLQLIKDQGSLASLEVSDLYRTYYSLYFSPCKDSDPHLYSWCVTNLINQRHRA